VRIRVSDNTGRARIRLFRNDLDVGLVENVSRKGRGDGVEDHDDGNVEQEAYLSTSYLPRHSDMGIVEALGEDCTEHFLYLSLEWNVDGPIQSPSTSQ